MAKYLWTARRTRAPLFTWYSGGKAMALKILVAEDEEITLKHLLSTLRSEGYEVSGTGNGREAFELVNSDNFDLLITDVKMPEMAGTELLEKVKELHPDIDVMIVTGFGSVGAAVEAMKKGAYDYITKPFDLDELVIKVRKISDKAKL